MQGLFGWVGNHTIGLFADEAEAIEDADQPKERAVEDQYAHPAGQHCLLTTVSETCTHIHSLC